MNEIIRKHSHIERMYILNFFSRFFDNESIDIHNAVFKMKIEDIFQVRNVGIILTGIIETGTITENSNIIIVNYNGVVKYRSVVAGLESMHIPDIKSASKGDNVGLRFTDTDILKYSKKGLYIVMI